MVVAGLCSSLYPSVDWSLVQSPINPGEPTSIGIKCYDKYNNKVTIGGTEFTIVATLLVGEVQTTVTTKVIDNNNGEYVVSFIPPFDGEYSINIQLGVDSYAKETFQFLVLRMVDVLLQ